MLAEYSLSVRIVVQKLGRDVVPDITTRYGLDGPGIESSGGDIFRTRPDRPWGPPSLQYRVLPGVKAALA